MTSKILGKRIKVGLLALGLVMWCDAPGLARPWLYEPANLQEARAFTRQMLEQYDRHGLFVEMRDAYLAEARAREGTARGGDLLVAAANITVIRLGDLEAARPIFQEAIRLYPGSMTEVAARSHLAQWEGRKSFDKVAVMSQISVDLGGPSVDEVLAATDTAQLAAQVRSLHPERQLGVWHVFQNIYYAMHKSEPDQAFKIAKFGRSALEQGALNGNDDFSLILTEFYANKYNPSGFINSLAANPRVIEVSPAPGSTTALNPTVSVRATTGDYHKSPIDLTQMELIVDGEIHHFDVVVTTELDLSFQENQDFEIVTLALPTTLPVGHHTATVRLRRQRVNADPPEGPGWVEKTWSFTVTNQPSQPTTETLPATKDALIDNFDPNGNEGSNSILALDKLLGRGSRSLVGFDLSGVDTNRLSKATLVLSIHKDEKIFGCGAGEQVSVQALTNTWIEGNGKTYKVLPLTARRRGSGAGATWNRDTDSNIANILANGGYAWNGGQSATMPRTAPMVMARDDMQGTLQFDVTQDVLNGAPHGWLIRKQHENLASRISFYSKEGAVAAGNTDLAPKLVLEYDGPTASLHPGVAKVASFLGLPTPKADSKPIQLREVVASSERPTLKNALQNHPTAVSGPWSTFFRRTLDSWYSFS